MSDTYSVSLLSVQQPNPAKRPLNFWVNMDSLIVRVLAVGQEIYVNVEGNRILCRIESINGESVNFKEIDK